MTTKTFLDYANHLLKDLTERSQNLVDYTRIGELVQSGTHRYSEAEIIARSSIIFTSIVAALLALEIQRKFNPAGIGPITATVIGGSVGFVTSHVANIWPMISKRQAMRAETAEIEQRIGNSFSADTHAFLAFGLIAHHFNHLSMATDKRANASQTLGARLRLFKLLESKLDELANTEEQTQFLMQDYSDVIDQLKTHESALSAEAAMADIDMVEMMDAATQTDPVSEIEITPLELPKFELPKFKMS